MNLMELQRGGIDRKNVLFLSYGIEIGTDIDNHHGVKTNFVIFNETTFL